jgi:hypothetical protein
MAEDYLSSPIACDQLLVSDAQLPLGRGSELIPYSQNPFHEVEVDCRSLVNPQLLHHHHAGLGYCIQYPSSAK